MHFLHNFHSMNFLSHLFLSGNSEGLIIGNFIADSVKGDGYKNFDHEIQKGILLHRKIDAYTDSHDIVEVSKQRLREKYKKYAGVIVDIYYDHFLAKNWSNYSEVDLKDYSREIYTLIEKNSSLLPQKSLMFKEYMIRYDILNAYAHLEGIDRVLKGMSRRTVFESNMHLAIADLDEHYDSFANEFKAFFPELRQYVDLQIEQ